MWTKLGIETRLLKVKSESLKIGRMQGIMKKQSILQALWKCAKKGN